MSRRTYKEWVSIDFTIHPDGTIVDEFNEELERNSECGFLYDYMQPYLANIAINKVANQVQDFDDLDDMSYADAPDTDDTFGDLEHFSLIVNVTIEIEEQYYYDSPPETDISVNYDSARIGYKPPGGEYTKTPISYNHMRQIENSKYSEIIWNKAIEN
jgi:hypothetical protein